MSKLTSFKQQHLTYAILTEFLNVIVMMPMGNLLYSLYISNFLQEIGVNELILASQN